MNLSGPCKAKGTSVTSDDWDAKCVITYAQKAKQRRGVWVSGWKTNQARIGCGGNKSIRGTQRSIEDKNSNKPSIRLRTETRAKNEERGTKTGHEGTRPVAQAPRDGDEPMFT